MDETTVLVNHTDSVTISIDAYAQFSTDLDYFCSEVNHVLRSCWVGRMIWFAGIPIGVQGGRFNPERGEEPFNERTRDSITTIDYHLHCS